MVPMWLPALNTGVILLSSVILERARSLVGSGDVGGYQRNLVGSLLLAAVFAALQVWLWLTMLAQGGTLTAGGLYGTHLYLMTGFHALHVLVGIGLSGWLRVGAAGPLQVTWRHRARMVAMFWHFVGVAWILMFLLLFVV